MAKDLHTVKDLPNSAVLSSALLCFQATLRVLSKNLHEAAGRVQKLRKHEV